MSEAPLYREMVTLPQIQGSLEIKDPHRRRTLR